MHLLSFTTLFSFAFAGSLSNTFTGTMFHYTAPKDSGSCMFFESVYEPYVSAVAGISPVQYANSDYCGACVNVTGTVGSAIVRIVDRCDACTDGGLMVDESVAFKIGNWS
jgi:hypothetical protein